VVALCLVLVKVQRRSGARAALVYPGHAALDLVGARVDAVAMNAAKRGAAPFRTEHLDHGRLIQAQLGERLPGLGAERLAKLGRIDLGQMDFEPPVPGGDVSVSPS
jgi:hypothetical protein